MTPAATLDSFHPYSATHAAVVVVFAAATAGLVLLGRRARGGSRGRGFDRGLAVGLFLVWVIVQGFGFLPWRYEGPKALPLHVCDVVGLVAPLALWAGWRPLRAVLYFWGLGLSSQGFIQPDLDLGPKDPSFWVFWGGHGAIVAAAVYDLAVRGFRPTWRDYGVAAAMLAGYVALVLPFDLLTGFNYGYVGRSPPGQPSVIDFLGPWPGRLGWLFLMVAGGLALFELPWAVVRWSRRRQALPRTGAAEPTTG